jgi:hypothetical protein
MIDILNAFPNHKDFTEIEKLNMDDPSDVLYTMRTRLFSGILKTSFSNGHFNVLLFKGRPLVTIFQSNEALKFGVEAIKMVKEIKISQNSKNNYMISDIDPVILKCFSSLLSRYPVFRNFNPQMLIIDELFNRMVNDHFSGCISINTRNDYVLLFVDNGSLLDIEDGQIVNRYPINESPVTDNMAKAVTLMSDSDASLDIYEVPEDLYSELTGWRFGIPFKSIVNVNLLTDELKSISREILKGKSNFFDRKLDDLGKNIYEIENYCMNLELYLDIDLSQRTLKSLTEKLQIAITDFKNS